MKKILGYTINKNLLIVNDNNKYEVKFEVVDLGENGWDSYYSNNSLKMTRVKTEKNPKYIFIKDIEDEDRLINYIFNYTNGKDF